VEGKKVRFRGNAKGRNDSGPERTEARQESGWRSEPNPVLEKFVKKVSWRTGNMKKKHCDKARDGGEGRKQ